MSLEKLGAHPFLRTPLTQAAEPSASPAQPGPSEEASTQAGSRKKHHLLRHELTADAQAAAVAHFGAESVDEAAHKVWGLKCVPGLCLVVSDAAARAACQGIDDLGSRGAGSTPLSAKARDASSRCPSSTVPCPRAALPSAGSASCRRPLPRCMARRPAHATMVRDMHGPERAFTAVRC